MPMQTYCMLLAICAWANGADPCWPIVFCIESSKNQPNITTSIDTPKPGKKESGSVRPGPGSESAGMVKIINADPNVDDWFQITTGVVAKKTTGY